MEIFGTKEFFQHFCAEVTDAIDWACDNHYFPNGNEDWESIEDKMHELYSVILEMKTKYGGVLK